MLEARREFLGSKIENNNIMQISDAPNVSNLVKKGLIEKTAGENLTNLVNQEKLPNWFRN